MPLHLTPTTDHHIPDPAALLMPLRYGSQKARVKAAIRALEELIQRGATVGEEGEEVGAEIALTVTPENKARAEEIFKGVKSLVPDHFNKPGMLVHLHSLLTSYDHAVVQDASQLRTYVKNRLIEESNSDDARIRLRALELLGKVTDVGLFTEKSETTVRHGTTEELQDALRNRIRRVIELDKDDVTDVT